MSAYRLLLSARTKFAHTSRMSIWSWAQCQDMDHCQSSRIGQGIIIVLGWHFAAMSNDHRVKAHHSVERYHKCILVKRYGHFVDAYPPYVIMATQWDALSMTNLFSVEAGTLHRITGTSRKWKKKDISLPKVPRGMCLSGQHHFHTESDFHCGPIASYYALEICHYCLTQSVVVRSAPRYYWLLSPIRPCMNGFG